MTKFFFWLSQCHRTLFAPWIFVLYLLACPATGYTKPWVAVDTTFKKAIDQKIALFEYANRALECTGKQRKKYLKLYFKAFPRDIQTFLEVFCEYYVDGSVYITGHFGELPCADTYVDMDPSLEAWFESHPEETRETHSGSYPTYNPWCSFKPERKFVRSEKDIPREQPSKKWQKVLQKRIKRGIHISVPQGQYKSWIEKYEKTGCLEALPYIWYHVSPGEEGHNYGALRSDSECGISKGYYNTGECKSDNYGDLILLAVSAAIPENIYQEKIISVCMGAIFDGRCWDTMSFHEYVNQSWYYRVPRPSAVSPLNASYLPGTVRFLERRTDNEIAGFFHFYFSIHPDQRIYFIGERELSPGQTHILKGHELALYQNLLSLSPRIASLMAKAYDQVLSESYYNLGEVGCGAH